MAVESGVVNENVQLVGLTASVPAGPHTIAVKSAFEGNVSSGGTSSQTSSVGGILIGG